MEGAGGFGGIVAFAGAWAVAHIIKLMTTWLQKGRVSAGEAVRTAFRSGGMPSSHTATMVALSTYLGLWGGFDSAVFALAVGVAIIVAYDAMNVRYAVGVMGEEMNRIVGKKGRIYEGHTLAQVVVGALVGIAVGWVVFLLKS